MIKDILIFEPLYRKNQRLKENLFSPLVIHDHSFSEWRELKHLVDLYDSGEFLKAKYTGLFSPKFQLKTHIDGQKFIEFVNNNPGADVYFINPFPQIKYWSYNVWMQGEIAHPGLICAATLLLESAQIPLDIKNTPRQGDETLSYSNFWIASPNFWKKYIGMVLKPIYEFLLNNPNHLATIQVLSETKHTVNGPLLPFIIERLFSTYLSFNQDIKVIAFKYTRNELIELCCLNDFERLLLIGMENEVDRADHNHFCPDDLVLRMKFTCQLFQKHHDDYYEFRKHPHLLITSHGN